LVDNFKVVEPGLEATIALLLLHSWSMGSIVQVLSWINRGICLQYKALRPADGSGGSRYSAGQKRCAMCELFIKWDGVQCPCCGCRLRANARNTVDRKKEVAEEELLSICPTFERQTNHIIL
jgi:hypothetical protein